MASLKEIEKELQRAKTEYDKYKVSANTDGSYTVAGKKVSSKDFGEARKKAKQKVDELTKTKRGFSNAQKTITGLQKTNQTLAKSLTRGSGSEATNATVQNQITANNARIAKLEKDFSFTPSPDARPAAEVVSPTQRPTGFSGMTVEQGRLLAGTEEVAPSGTGTGASTKTGTGTSKNKKTTTSKKDKTNTAAWKAIIQEEFGSLWDVYNDNGDVKKVIDQSVKEGWFNDSVKLTESLRNTNWFRTTESSARQYTISQSTDPATAEATLNKRVEEIRAQSLNSGVSLSEATLRDLGERSLKFGWTEQQVANGVGSEAVATANRGGTAGVADLRRGSTGTELRGIADNYGIKVSDTMLDEYVAKILQGTTTKVQFTDQMKNQASTMYRSLAPQIEKGMDVKTATSMYTNIAASTLGVDPATVDWTQDKWNKALNYQDPKTNEYRQMDSYEWNRYLRSLPEWQETDDAKQTYRRAAFTLAQAFGKTS
jgi:hypothetical protein